MTAYDEAVRKIADHDELGRVIYNEKIYDEIYDYEEDEYGNPIDHYKKHSDGRYVLDGDGEKILKEGTTYASRYGELEKFAVDLRKLDHILDPGDEAENILRKELKRGAISVPTVIDPSRHTIVLFESNSPNDYHGYIYNEFNAVIDKLSYDFYLMTGEVPRINLVSHSMGGVITMMYMTEHPYNVANYISIDSPHNFINTVAAAELFLPVLNYMNLPGTGIALPDTFWVSADAVHTVTLLMEIVLPLIDEKYAESLPELEFQLLDYIWEGVTGDLDGLSDHLETLLGLPEFTSGDINLLIDALSATIETLMYDSGAVPFKADALESIETLKTAFEYDAEKESYEINTHILLGSVLSSIDFAKIFKGDGGTKKFDNVNITVEDLEYWLAQMSDTPGANLFWMIQNWPDISLLVNDFLRNGGAVQNFMNPKVYETRRDEWNKVYSEKKPNVNAIAIGGSPRIDYLIPDYGDRADWVKSLFCGVVNGVNAVYEGSFSAIEAVFDEINLTLTDTHTIADELNLLLNKVSEYENLLVNALTNATALFCVDRAVWAEIVNDLFYETSLLIESIGDGDNRFLTENKLSFNTIYELLETKKDVIVKELNAAVLAGGDLSENDGADRYASFDFAIRALRFLNKARGWLSTDANNYVYIYATIFLST
ncbi:MAG: alpha/beta hydrolase [Clostridiales bacterium]|nr:alpha/beta hydrolase [Clostridiales bacterium]